MVNKFYITTPIYYANAKPHIGHAYTTIAADVLARFYKLQNKEVFLLAGMDEHGFKIQQAAEKVGKNPQDFVDEIAQDFKKLWKDLGIDYSGFVRTTDKNHKETVQKVLQMLYDKGAIYKGEYEGLYCVGCEQFKSENELADGKCPDHDTIPEKMKEECYLLKMSDKQTELIEKIKSDEFKIAPERYKNEILSFLESQKLNDISISRKNVKWGIELPFDSKHTAYVWVDALLNYLTGIGWDPVNSLCEHGASGELFNKFWGPDVQLIGKDILRVHATIWPIILMHIGIELPKMIFTHGHILSGGKKMSKTLGNIIDPDEMIEKFGADGARYLLLSAGPFGEDIDMTIERMIEKYNADLANGLGNLVSRVIKLAQMTNVECQISNQCQNPNDKILKLIEKLELDQALGCIWKIIADDNKYIADNKPWKLVKTDEEKFKEVMQKLLGDLNLIAETLNPFMPETSEKIKKALETKKLDGVLFMRIK